MASDFSRVLALLRREKKISQRTAAGDLGVSQALLSHYENGLREPGLSFVVRAADYYGVSCDYLLGRSMAQDGSAIPAGRMDMQADTAQEQNAIALAMALIINLADKIGSTQLSHEVEAYFSIIIYKAYRYMYLADPTGVEAVFRTSRDRFEYLCDARLKQHELCIRSTAQNAGSFALGGIVSPNEIIKQYPEQAGALLTILQQVSDSIDALGKKFEEK